MSLLCPVCQQPMQSTDSTSIFQCARRKAYIPELDAEVDTIHATIYLNETGRQIIKVIEVGPYAFEIHDDETIQKTRVTKLMEPGKGKRKRNSARTFERQTLLVVPSVIHAPWHDPQQVVEKIKLYMWFT